MTNIINIEDLLEVSANLHIGPKILLDKEDMTIMNSIARQTFKGTALTDRQHALMKEKLLKYKQQFLNLDCDFDYAIEQLRNPLRKIDRSKYIKIVNTDDVYSDNDVYESYKSKWKWIKVRFPFSKKLIIDLQSIQCSANSHVHFKGSHEHFFLLNENNLYNVVKTFKGKNFEIQQELLNLYDEIETIKTDKEKYVPSIQNYSLLNLNSEALKQAEHDLGKITKSNFLKFIDRRRRYGVVDYDNPLQSGSLHEKIATRDKQEILFNPDNYRIEDVLLALEDLDRYPLLVVLNEHKAESQLHEVYNSIRHYISNEYQSVLFRLDEKDSEFNQMIKEYKLNNWVDKSTKIVYISNNKLPKICLSSDWKPIASFNFDSRVNRNVDSYISEFCDLIVYYDKEISPFRRYSSYYG